MVETAEFEVEVNEFARFFEGHFPGDPVFPAVAQLVELVDRQARKRLRGLTHRYPSRVVRAKFEAPVRPNDRLRVQLRCEGEVTPQLRFMIEKVNGSDVVRVSSGLIEYGLVIQGDVGG
ncbi:MAG: hypothetical protein RMJ84_03980 [Sandaracinaceae bacterium]|nr:hypothetical protein [Sandaracinaceae bacterium]